MSELFHHHSPHPTWAQGVVGARHRSPQHKATQRGGGTVPTSECTSSDRRGVSCGDAEHVARATLAPVTLASSSVTALSVPRCTGGECTDACWARVMAHTRPTHRAHDRNRSPRTSTRTQVTTLLLIKWLIAFIESSLGNNLLECRTISFY